MLQLLRQACALVSRRTLSSLPPSVRGANTTESDPYADTQQMDKVMAHLRR